MALCFMLVFFSLFHDKYRCLYFPLSPQTYSSVMLTDNTRGFFFCCPVYMCVYFFHCAGLCNRKMCLKFIQQLVETFEFQVTDQ